MSNKAFYLPIYKLISACIPTSAQGTDQCRSFCPKNCQAEYSCKNGCPVCQDGWMGVYCENRKYINFILLLLLPIIWFLPKVHFFPVCYIGNILPYSLSKSFRAIELYSYKICIIVQGNNEKKCRYVTKMGNKIKCKMKSNICNIHSGKYNILYRQLSKINIK